MKTGFFIAVAFAMCAFLGCKKQSLDEAVQTSASLTGEAGRNLTQVNVFKGPEVQIGLGRARSFFSVDHAGVPQELGIEFTHGALFELPITGEWVLPLHAKAKDMTAFEHIYLDYNEHGHEPPGVFDVPHFDMHFYMTTNEERMAIPPYTVAQQAFDNLPPQNIWPPMYFPIPGGVPQMGKHWIDAFFAPPFSKTLIYGSYDGKFTFVEPMITRQYLLSGTSYSEAYRQPLQYIPANTFYPEVYNIYMDAATQKHYVTLSGFSWR